MKFDDATEAYIARLLDEAPPLDPEQAALVIRTFVRNPRPPVEPLIAAA